MVLGRTYDGQNCSAARALEVVGERWSLLILRDALFRSATRFSDFQSSLGVAPNVLAARLQRFVDAGLLQKDTSGGGPAYRLTAKGFDLAPVVVALTAWGDRWDAPDGPPVVFEHDDCDGRVGLALTCAACGRAPRHDEVRAMPGPGSRRR